MADLVSTERGEGVALVTLDRPEKRNALSIEMRDQLAEALEGLGADAAVGSIVLTGAGTAFCAGMDLTQFGGEHEHRLRLVESSIRAFAAVGRCPRPVIAAINGPAVAGGFALALLCDVRVAAPSATVGFPELPRGIPPSYAAAGAALPAAVARELCLTGRLLDADEATQLGVVGEVAEDVVARASELAAEIAAMPREAVLATKRRALLERDSLWGFLFDEEEREFREALLGGGA